MGLNQAFDLESRHPFTLPATVGISSPRWASFTTGSLANRRPRGVPWSTYPVITPPWLKTATDYRARVHTRRGGEARPTGHAVTLEQAFATASAILVGEPANLGPVLPGDDKLPSITLTLAALAARDLATNVETVGLQGPGGDIKWYDPGDALEATRGLAGLVRFHHCHELNAAAILQPALAHATSSLDDAALRGIQDTYNDLVPEHRDRRPAEAMARSLRQGHLRHLGRPGTLQVLFRLRRMGRAPHPVQARVPTIVEALEGVFARREAGMHLWVGTGKHPGVWTEGSVVRKVAGTLHHFGLARSDGTALMLTDAGERFLDCLHPDAEDPDVLCRWVAPAMANEDIDDRVNAWILRVFSKCKTRVNRLP